MQQWKEYIKIGPYLPKLSQKMHGCFILIYSLYVRVHICTYGSFISTVVKKTEQKQMKQLALALS